MFKNVYIGSSIKFKDICDNLSRDLFIKFGIKTVRKWWISYTKEIDKFAKFTNEEFMNHPQVRAIGDSDFRAIEKSDFVVIVVQNGYKLTGGYVELGYALGKGKPVYILGEPKKSAMFSSCIRISDYNEFLDIIGEVVS